MKKPYLMFLPLLFTGIFSCDGILTINYSNWMQEKENTYPFRQSIANDVISKKYYFIGHSKDFLFQALGRPDGWKFDEGNNCLYRLDRTSNGERRLNHNQYLVFWYDDKGRIVSMEIVKT